MFLQHIISFLFIGCFLVGLCGPINPSHIKTEQKEENHSQNPSSDPEDSLGAVGGVEIERSVLTEEPDPEGEDDVDIRLSSQQHCSAARDCGQETKPKNGTQGEKTSKGVHPEYDLLEDRQQSSASPDRESILPPQLEIIELTATEISASTDTQDAEFKIKSNLRLSNDYERSSLARELLGDSRDITPVLEGLTVATREQVETHFGQSCNYCSNESTKVYHSDHRVFYGVSLLSEHQFLEGSRRFGNRRLLITVDGSTPFLVYLDPPNQRMWIVIRAQLSDLNREFFAWFIERVFSPVIANTLTHCYNEVYGQPQVVSQLEGFLVGILPMLLMISSVFQIMTTAFRIMLSDFECGLRSEHAKIQQNELRQRPASDAEEREMEGRRHRRLDLMDLIVNICNHGHNFYEFLLPHTQDTQQNVKTRSGLAGETQNDMTKNVHPKSGDQRRKKKQRGQKTPSDTQTGPHGAESQGATGGVDTEVPRSLGEKSLSASKSLVGGGDQLAVVENQMQKVKVSDDESEESQCPVEVGGGDQLAAVENQMQKVKVSDDESQESQCPVEAGGGDRLPTAEEKIKKGTISGKEEKKPLKN